MAAFGSEEGEVPEEMDETELEMTRQGLFKVMIVDQQNQPTGVAYVTQEQADQISAGLLTVQLTADNQVALVPTEGAEEGAPEAAELPEETTEEVGAQADTTLEADEELEIAFAEGETEEEAGLDGIDVEPLPPGSNTEELHRVPTSLDNAGRTVCLRALLSPQQLRQLDELASDFCVRIDPGEFSVPPFINCPFPSHVYNELLQTVRAQPTTPLEIRKWREAVRRHAVLHGRLKKPGSKPIAAREVAINEAAAAICRRIPTLLFYRRELSSYAKQLATNSKIRFKTVGYEKVIITERVRGYTAKHPITGVSHSEVKSEAATASKQAAAAAAAAEAESAAADASVAEDTSPLLDTEVEAIAQAVDQALGIEEGTTEAALREQQLLNLSAVEIETLGKTELPVYNELVEVLVHKPLEDPARVARVRVLSALYTSRRPKPLTHIELAVNETAFMLCNKQPYLLFSKERGELFQHVGQILSSLSVDPSLLQEPNNPTLVPKPVAPTAPLRKPAPPGAPKPPYAAPRPPMSSSTPAIQRNFQSYAAFGVGRSQIANLHAAAERRKQLAALRSTTDVVARGGGAKAGRPKAGRDRADVEIKEEPYEAEVEFEEPEKVLNEDTLKEALMTAGEESLDGIDLSSVGQLHLDNRQITKIEPPFLNKFTILEELNLSANRIREFPEDIRLPALKKLDLHLNPLVTFSLKALLFMPALEEILFDERPGRLSLSADLVWLICPHVRQVGEPRSGEYAASRSVRVLKSRAENALCSIWRLELDEDQRAEWRQRLLDAFALGPAGDHSHYTDWAAFFCNAAPFAELCALVEEKMVQSEIQHSWNLPPLFTSNRFVLIPALMRNVVRTKLMIDEYVSDTDLDISTLPPLLVEEVKLQRERKAKQESAPKRQPLQPLNKEAQQQQPQVVGKCAFVKLESCVQMPTEHLPAAVLAKKSQLIITPPSEPTAPAAVSSAAPAHAAPTDVYNFDDTPPPSTTGPSRSGPGTGLSQSTKAKVVHAAAAVRQAAARRSARMAANPEERLAQVGEEETEEEEGIPELSAEATAPGRARSRGSTARKRGRPPGVSMNAVKKIKNAYMDEEYVFWASDEEEDLNPREDFIGKMAERKKAALAAKRSHAGPPAAASGSPLKTGAAKEKDKDKEKEPAEELAPEPAAGARRPESLCSTWIDEKDLGPKLTLQQATDLYDYDPLNFIRCHAKENNPRDAQTKVWRAAFIPDKEQPSIVATCGGECVCLIDCATGRVVKRQKFAGDDFYSLSWTTLRVPHEEKEVSLYILAVSSESGNIKLFVSENLHCYEEMRGHRKAVSAIEFHPTWPRILFTSDSSATILIWDIGLPSYPNIQTHHTLLYRYQCPRPNVNAITNLCFARNNQFLIAGCEDGIFAWKLEFDNEADMISKGGTATSSSRQPKMPHLEIQLPVNSDVCYDGLAALTDTLIAAKCVEDGRVLVFDFSQSLQKKPYGGVVQLEPVMKLEWKITEEIYINVTSHRPAAMVLSGDNQGCIWLYYLGEKLRELQSMARSQLEEIKMRGVDHITPGSMPHIRIDLLTRPFRILEWPECSVGDEAAAGGAQPQASASGGILSTTAPVVNNVTLSADSRYLVAVTDNNLVCIWRQAPSSGTQQAQASQPDPPAQA